MSSHPVASARRFVRSVRQWWYTTSGKPSPLELAVSFGAIPAVLTAIWILPIGYEWGLSLAAESIREPGVLVSAYTLNYVHVDAQHLFDNVLNYVVTLAAIYPLVGIAGWRQRLAVAGGVYLTIGPAAITWLTLSAIGGTTPRLTVGFSGLTATLLGFLLVALFAATEAATDRSIQASWAVIPFVVSIAATLLFSSIAPVPLRGDLVALCTGVTLFSIGAVLRSRPRYPSLDDHVLLAILIGSTIYTVGVLGALFLVPNGTNIWGHFGGYLFGFSFAYVAFVVPVSLLQVISQSREADRDRHNR
ncbi:hypothetical protein [Halalkalirubrum salinum]|uniref:hypothetical protein n=1 Tax=Halalkalirubrum salinum TaxID=2563889 RepID=UPI0010FB9813|nr:hypothetical protein [Halalkalirubrum salinum]